MQLRCLLDPKSKVSGSHEIPTTIVSDAPTLGLSEAKQDPGS